MNDAFTPSERLAFSRAALLAAMGYNALETTAVGPSAAASWNANRRGRASLIGRWWRRSHLSTFAEIGMPFLQDYASRHPARLVAYAAGTGSLIVLVRAWRILSFGMVVGLVLRSTDLSALLSDGLAANSGAAEGTRDDFLDQPARQVLDHP